MTAEIAVMNKLGVALAADSAATIGYQSGHKIYNSANKLFMLSAVHPVGIMVFGAAEFMHVPWETILKLYRLSIGAHKFATLQEYVPHFVKFLEDHQEEYFPPQLQEMILRNTLAQYLWSLRESVQIDEASAWENLITQKLNELHNLSPLDHVDEAYTSTLEQQVTQLFDQLYESIIKPTRMPPKLKKSLKQILLNLITKDIFPGNSSGVVFAGYGEKEIFPSVIETQMHSIFAKRLKFARRTEEQISVQMSALIRPFAQTEMVSAFIEGVNPEYQQTIEAYLSSLFNSYPGTLLKHLPDLNAEEKTNLANILKQVGVELFKDFTREMRNFRSKVYVNPVVTNIAFLPLDELASMAEALVNLTSFKRHVSPESETVGGPIDVAVISKKDGFVWIKRKHYFTPDLNKHFFDQHDRYLSEREDKK